MDTRNPPTPPPPEGGENRMPRWVKGFIVAAFAAVLLAVVVLAIGRGDHGPSRHLPGGVEETTQTPQGHTPPFGHA